MGVSAKYLILIAMCCLPTLLKAQNDSLRAEEYFSKARVLSSQAKYDSSNLYYERVLPIFKQYKQWEGYFYSLIFLSDNYNLQGNYTKASLYAQQVIRESEAHLGSDNVFQGMAYQSEGSAVLKRGFYDKAIEYFEQAHAIFYLGNPQNRVHLPSLLIEIGNAYREKGSPTFAVEYYTQARNLFLERNSPINAKIADFNIATVLVMKEEYQEACKIFEEILTFFVEYLGPNHPAVASIYNNLGSAYLYSEAYSKALPLFEKTLAIKQQTHGEQHLETARSYFNLGYCYEELQNFEAAKVHLQKAKNILAIIFQEKHPLLAWTYNRMGKVALKEQNFSQALNYYAQAEQANSYQLKNSPLYLDAIRISETNQFRAEVYREMFRLKPQKEYLEQGSLYLKKCDELIRELRTQINNESDKIELNRTAKQIYEDAVALHYSLFQTTQDQAHLYQIFQYIEKSKATVLLESLQDASAKKFAGIPDSVLTEEIRLKNDIAEYRQKLLAWSPSSDSPEEKEFLEEALFYTSQTYLLFLEKISYQYPDYYHLKYNPEEITPQQIQKKLDAATALIDYFVADSVIYQVVLTQNDIAITPIEGKNEEMRKFIRGLRNGILNQKTSLWKQSAENLYAILFPRALPSHLKHLLIVPDAQMSSIPFEVLLTNSSTNVAPQEMPFLLKNRAVSYAYSAQLAYQKMENAQQSSKNTLLAFAPIFDNQNDTIHITLKTRELLTEASQGDSSEALTRGNLFDGQYISPLPGTATEVKQIYTLFEEKQHRAEVFMGEHAKEDIFKDKELEKYKYIHIATHGFVNEDTPELSGILLSLPTDSTAEQQNDGILFVGEMYNLQLEAELVTLSACQTGLGKIAKGEGVIGLTRALLYAGAKNITVSLWKVGDESTSALMIEFYKNILSQNQGSTHYSEAIRQAKLWLLSQEKYAEPYYWSPFILIGR